MTTLSGQTLKDSFSELLKISGNSLTTVLQPVEDGDGNSSPLMLSTGAMSLNGLQWPTVNGGYGTFLQVGTNNTLTWAAINFNPTVPTASATVLGSVKVGNNLSIDGTGALSISSSYVPYVLPTASSTVKGGVKVGSGFNIDSTGVLSIPASSKTGILASGNIMYSATNPGSGFLDISNTQLLPLTNAAYANIIPFFPNTEWNPLTVGNTTIATKLLKFKSGGLLFVAAGLQLATSTDFGYTWTVQTLSEQLTCISGIVSGSTVKYVAGCVSGNFGTSVDGINWTFTAPATPEQVHSISNSMPLIASTIGATKAKSSLDGVTWTVIPSTPVQIDRLITMPAGVAFPSSAVIGAAKLGTQCYQYNGSAFVAVGNLAPTALSNLTLYNSAAYFSSSLSPTSITIYRTYDFVTYTPFTINISSSTAVEITDMWATNDNRLFATTNTNAIVMSTDGINFTLINSGVPAVMANVVDANNEAFFLSTIANATYGYTPLNFDTTQYFQVPSMPSYLPRYRPYLKL
jgi:hypothetical protein